MPDYQDDRFSLHFDTREIVDGAIVSYLVSLVAWAFDGSGLWNVWHEIDLVGDRTSGSLDFGDGEGNSGVLAWEGDNLVAFEFQLGFGPIEEADLTDVTGGPEDVRALLPGLPDELEPLFQRAARRLRPGSEGELSASAGLWLTRDDVGCSVFERRDSPVPGEAILRWGMGGGPGANPASDSDEEGSDDEESSGDVGAPLVALFARLLPRLPVELSADEAALIVGAGKPRSGRIEELKKAFGAVGIRWPAG